MRINLYIIEKQKVEGCPYPVAEGKPQKIESFRANVIPRAGETVIVHKSKDKTKYMVQRVQHHMHIPQMGTEVDLICTAYH